MDGVLVNNTRAHVRAFEIFCKRYGVEEWQRKLQTSFGMGNDDYGHEIEMYTVEQGEKRDKRQ